MSFEIYLKKEIQNEISQYVHDINKCVKVPNCTITNGYVKISNYWVPLSNILFIKEV